MLEVKRFEMRKNQEFDLLTLDNHRKYLYFQAICHKRTISLKA